MASEVSGLDLHPLSGSSSALWSAQSPVLRIVLTHLQLMTAVSNLRNKDLSEQRSRVREQIVFARFVPLYQRPCPRKAHEHPLMRRSRRDTVLMPAPRARRASAHRESLCLHRRWRTSDLECKLNSCVGKSHALFSSGSRKHKKRARTLFVRQLQVRGRRWWLVRHTSWRRTQTEQRWSSHR